MDHFSPSYFALLGPLDLEELIQTVIPKNSRRVLGIISGKDIHYMLACDTAMTIHGILRLSRDLELLVRQDVNSMEQFQMIMRSEGFRSEEDPELPYPQTDGKYLPSTTDSVTLPIRFYLPEDPVQGFRVSFQDPEHFNQAFERRISIKKGSISINLLSLEDLILIKSGSDDPADRADAEALEKIRRGKKF